MAGENYKTVEVGFSIINSTPQDDIRDSIAPLSFLDFITYTRVDYTPEEYSSFYNKYLKLWYSKQGGSKAEQLTQFKNYYKEFIQEIVVNYTTESEKRFLQKINFNDPADLDIAIPFFANKLKDIALFYKKKRDESKYVIERNKIKGSKTGVEKAIFDNIYNFVITAEDTLHSKTYDIDTIAANFNIDIEEYIDVYSNYFDLPRTTTDDGLREEIYDSNINDIESKYFLDPDAIDALTSTSFLESIRSFSINPPKLTINTFDPICNPENPLNTLINNNTIDGCSQSKIYALKRRLLEKYIGTDIYYIDTTSFPPTSGLLIQADTPTNNLLNLQTADTATVESNEIRLLRDVGIFFEPDNIGLFKLNADNYTYTINVEDLENNKVYIFPDPELYGNVTVNPQSAYPVTFKIDNRKNIRNASSGIASGDPYITHKTTTFEPYNTKERDSDELSILNELSYNLNFTDLYEEGIIDKYQFDPYGNEYALFKAQPLKPLEEKTNNTVLNLLLDGYEFFDDIEGHNFNYSLTGSLNGSIRSGLSSYTDGFTTVDPDLYMYFREFTPYQELIQRTRSINPIWRDGGAFAFLDNTLLPEPLSGFDPNWPGPLNYYYTILAEGTFPILDSIGTEQSPLSNIATEDDLFELGGNNYEFNFATDIKYYLSAGDQYKYYNGGYFTDDISLKNSFNYADDYIYLDDVSDDSLTVLSSLTSESVVLTNEDKKRLTGKIYIKNQRYSQSLPISAALSNILSKYSTAVQNDIYNNTVDFDVINDCIVLQTPNNLAIDKIAYTNGVFEIPNTKNTLFSINSAVKTNQFSNRFYIEGTDSIYFTIFETISTSFTSASAVAKNYWYIVPNIYVYNTHTCNYSKLFPLQSTEQTLSSFRTSLSGTINNNFAAEKIQTPFLTYNKLNNVFKLTYIVNDLNELTHIYDAEFELNNCGMALKSIYKYNTLESCVRSTTFGQSTQFATVSSRYSSYTIDNTNFNLTI